jgi:hypothetical protein
MFSNVMRDLGRRRSYADSLEKGVEVIEAAEAFRNGIRFRAGAGGIFPAVSTFGGQCLEKIGGTWVR